MTLSAPTMIVFIISIVVAALALLSGLGILSILPISAFWLALVAYVILLAGNLLKGV